MTAAVEMWGESRTADRLIVTKLDDETTESGEWPGRKGSGCLRGQKGPKFSLFEDYGKI